MGSSERDLIKLFSESKVVKGLSVHGADSAKSEKRVAEWQKRLSKKSKNMDKENLSVFPVGDKNDAFAKYFVGQSYLNMLSTEQVLIGNVTFEPRCRNNWHIHHADNGGGQILLVTAGHGWYCERGKSPRALAAGDVVNIPANVKHWHGASKNSVFQHLAIEVPAENGRTEWCEPVTDEEYDNLEK